MPKEEPYSLSKAIIETLEKGAPVSGAESEFHYAEARARAKAPPSSPLAGLANVSPLSLHVPLDSFSSRAVSATGSGSNLIGEEKQIVSPLLTWSAATQAGATTLTGLRDNVSLAHVSKLPEPEWSSENGAFIETDPEFAAVPLGPPKRVGALVKVSRLLLASASPGLDQLLSDDLGKACSRQLDRICFYGTGNNNQPRGILSTPGIHLINVSTDDPGWENFCEAERLIENEDTGPNSAFVTSPDLKAELRRRSLWVGGSGQTLWDSLTNPVSSKGITGDHIFFGNFPVGLIIGIWGDSADIVVNRFTHTAFVDIVCNLWCSLAIRAPGLFGVMTLPIARAPAIDTAPPKAEGPKEEPPAESWTGEGKEKGNNRKK
jgi:hypothetical protein